MKSNADKVYTRGGPLTPVELYAAREGSAFIWRTFDRLYFTLDRLEDDHLLNIELHLMGRSEYALPEGYDPRSERWNHTYDVIRAEIDRRGLALKESTGARVDDNDEKFIAHDDPEWTDKNWGVSPLMHLLHDGDLGV